MDAEFDADQDELRATVRRFLADRAPLTPYVRDRLADPRGTTADVWRGLADLGALGLLVPERFGGAGRGMVDAGVVLEELGRVVHPGPYLSSAVTATSTVTALASDDQQAALLPAMAAGDVVATVALHEPGAHHRWRTPATKASGGTVTGTKAAVPDAAGADVLLVAAVDEHGLGVHRVDAGAAGVTITPVESVDGTTKLATVAFDAAPAERLGTEDATDALSLVVDRTVVALVTQAVGTASAALDLAVEYAKERMQFDRPIGSFQAVQHLLVDMLRDLELGRAGAYYGLWAADAADAAEQHRAATMAKAWAGDAFFRIGADAIQVFGGVGFTWEHDVHLLYKRLLSLQQTWGTTTEHLEELAAIALSQGGQA